MARKTRLLSDDEIAMIIEIVEARELARLCACGHSRISHLGGGDSLFGHNGPCKLDDCTCSEFSLRRNDAQELPQCAQGASQCAQDAPHGPPFAPSPARSEVTDSVRMDWIENTGLALRYDWAAAITRKPAWYTLGKGPQYKRPRYRTAREAIDAALAAESLL